MSHRMLSKDDEPPADAEIQVRREDQEMINRFSSLHQREVGVEGVLGGMLKEKEDLEEIAAELELVDEEERVPYKIGDAFVSLPQPQVLDLLAASTADIDDQVAALRTQLESVQDEMGALKKVLYGRFGRSINLET